MMNGGHHQTLSNACWFSTLKLKTTPFDSPASGGHWMPKENLILTLNYILFSKSFYPICCTPRLWAEWNDEWKLANSNYRKTYINLKQIVHSLNLRSPLFRIDWCGNYNPSPRRTFHSSRRSGSVLVLFCYRKRTRPPRLWAEWNYKWWAPPNTIKRRKSDRHHYTFTQYSALLYYLCNIPWNLS
jgi:hypothetical protein